MATNVTAVNCIYSSGVVEIPFDEKASFEAGEKVIFKDEDGKEEFGVVKAIKQKATDEDKIMKRAKLLRRATPHDVQRAESHGEQAARALDTCKELVKKMEVEMYVFSAGYSFDGSKVHFMFTADERVDFRELVKELAKKLKKQIHLRQIGPRDKAKIIGGYGRCGRSLCCNTFLGKLESINMEMVRHQGLESKGSSKLSGACGKLLCCLRYEVEAYKELKKSLPGMGCVVRLKKRVEAPGREGMVIALDILNQKARVLFDKGESVVVEAKDIEKVVKEAVENRS